MRSLRGTAAAAALAIAAAGCAAGGGGGGSRSVIDATWGWGWDLSGAPGPYARMSPAEREREFDYYRSKVKTVDAAGKPIPLVAQVEFLKDAKSNTAVNLPPAGFVDAQGRPVRLEEWKGKATLVLVFTRGYPGYVCPLCSSYTAQLAHRYAEIKAAGGEVLVVFPGAPGKVEDFVRASREILEQEGPGSLPFPVLLDVDLSQVAAFGIQGDLAKPSTYVIDRAGAVRYAFVGSQPHERPDVATVLAEIRRAEGKK